MQIHSIPLDVHQPLLQDYYNESEYMMSHFHYNPFDESSFQTRLKDLKNNTYNRNALTDALKKMNANWAAPEESNKNIERLKDDNSVVVIAGQQAGLLTGPLYTINKILSVLQMAKEQEKKQGVPVIPVFWMAGEDHDFAEINHVYMPDEGGMKKKPIGQHAPDKVPVSSISIDHEKALQWLDDLFMLMNETAHSKNLYETLSSCLKHSKTYVDFFARVIYRLFPNSGLVLVDSDNRELRQLETDCFLELINRQPEIANGVHQSVQSLKQHGYTLSLETEPDEGHLFYHVNGQRLLLFKEENTGLWRSKAHDIELTTENLLETASRTPERLSNNVVTRPLMQEWLFPALAFLGGPGEISYWAALKPAFSACGLKMPPVLPRKSFTYVGRDTERALQKHHIHVGNVIRSGTSGEKGNWLSAQFNPPIEEMVTEVKRAITTAHQPLSQAAEKIQPDLGHMAQTNLLHLHRELEQLEKHITKRIKARHREEIAEFDLIEQAIRPLSNLQERIWTPLPFLNDCGMEMFEKLANQPWPDDQGHYVVYL
ncbi:putative cysteine ligase BshC [Lentibacillus sp. JNUCC-1]|uniref:bacillithiol biosynthesis cysteine-adding enzyme BshC n=1 Tax=Lentibacillus sp. JNUCC-1 TaxID=2654513 RepID=UPI0013265A5A|nr:bacillithiol biosynthesis cysteine-adding enzyme BshC [Lentibacillus sp. JNUCC-1]MUV36231.1 putative cysteine ligase BshC [Lentibacillus sp. JNUCC-1]